MDKVYYAKSSSEGQGLCQQIFNLANAIIEANKQNIKMVAVDNLTFHHSETKDIPISLIIDLEKLNYVLSRRYCMYIYDKNFLRFELRSIFYGVTHRENNVTKEVLDHFCDENEVITISKDMSLTPMLGDPFIGVIKRLLVNYTVKYKDTDRYNSFSMEEYAGCLKEDLIIDYNVDKGNYILNNTPLIETDKHMFDYILKQITFDNKYIQAANEFINFIGIKDKKVSKINVIHLRLEDDVVEKFGKDKGDDYISNLEDKYIEAIKQNIDKADDTIILSYSLNNRVLKFLKENEYKFYLKEKEIEAGREINEIIDLLIGKYCNNTYIYNFNEVTMQGSCFSYYLLQHLSNQVNKISIEL